MAVLWLVLGGLLLLASAAVIVRMPRVELGPYATRLLGLAVAMFGYYGASALWPAMFGQLRVYGARVVYYAVPVAAGLAALYCLWRIVRSWRSEIHGIVTNALRLLAALMLAVLARWCLAR